MERRPFYISTLGKLTEHNSAFKYFKQKLAQAMAIPLMRRMDYTGIARKTLMVDPMPQGALPTYDRDIDVSAVLPTKKFFDINARGKLALSKKSIPGVRRSLPYHGIARRAIKNDFLVINDRGKLTDRKSWFSASRVKFPTFEIVSSPSIRLTDVKRRRFKMFER